MVRCQGKPFIITVIQVCTLTSDAEEAEVERFYEDLQDLLELTPKIDVLFIIVDWKAKVGSQEILRVIASLAVVDKMKQGKGQQSFAKGTHGHRKITLPKTKEMTLHMYITRSSILKSD